MICYVLQASQVFKFVAVSATSNASLTNNHPFYNLNRQGRSSRGNGGTGGQTENNHWLPGSCDVISIILRILLSCTLDMICSISHNDASRDSCRTLHHH